MYAKSSDNAFPPDAKELYSLYCQGLEEAKLEVKRDFRSKSSREYLLSHCKAEPFERFEAKIATLASRGQLEAYSRILRAGFVACE